jgi:hypothetical protein
MRFNNAMPDQPGALEAQKRKDKAVLDGPVNVIAFVFWVRIGIADPKRGRLQTREQDTPLEACVVAGSALPKL